MTPFAPILSAPNGLCLYVEEAICSCCGHKWTHCYSVLTIDGRYYGIPPTDAQKRTLKLERVQLLHTSAPACFRCVPAGLPQGFPKLVVPPTPPVAPSRPRLSVETLDKDIFG